MITPEFKNLMLKAKKDISFDDENLFVKIKEMPRLTQEYLNRCMVESEKLKSILYLKESLYKKLYNDYKFDGQFNYDNREEIKWQIMGDTKYLELRRQYDDQERIVKFLEQCISNIKSLFYDMKLYQDIKLFKNGFSK